MSRVEEIREELKCLEKILDEKDKSWDFANNSSWEGYKKYCEFLAPEENAITELYRELRFIKPYTLSELSEDLGHIMPLQEFIDNCNDGGFIDYDGWGYYVKDGKKSDITIIPSDIKHNKVRKDFDTIVWLNR